MGIEIRNFKPKDGSTGVAVFQNISFDIVGTGGDQVDIGTLQVELRTTNIDGTEGSLFYSIIPQGYSYGYNNPNECGDDQDFYNAINSAMTFSGNCIHYSVELDPVQPFDLGQVIEVTVRVSDTDGNAMDAFVTSFTVFTQDLISDFEFAFISDAQNIPVYHERLRNASTSDFNPTVFDSAFENWLRKPKPIVRYNDVIIDEQGTTFTPGYKIDYNNGRIIFDSALDINDEIDVSYHFRCFSEDQINRFFSQSTSYYRVSPKFGGPTSIYGADQTTRDIIMIGAAAYAYRQLMVKLAFQEKRIIFDNHSWEDAWSKIKDLFSQLADAYDKDWQNILKAKEVALPRIASVVTPEFTLPGGRARMFRYLYKNGSMGG